jgi:nicotinamidase-related amidase
MPDPMNTHLFIIDPQNDFCDIPGAALPVSGAHEDMGRLARFMEDHRSSIDGISVTLDSHPSVAVERTTFWMTAAGEPVTPFTFITGDDVLAARYAPRDPTHVPAVLQMLEQLAARGRPGLVVWPVHCVTGTWGHNIHDAVSAQLQSWEFAHQRPVRKVLKGEYPLSEHFGAFEADAPAEGVPSTQFNTALATLVTQGVDVLLLAGEASSHCVASSFDQLASFLASRQAPHPRILVLRDCMSPVHGFEDAASAFFERARAFGAQIVTTQEASDLIGSRPGLRAHD